MDNLWISQWIVGNLWTTMWSKKRPIRCRFCLRIRAGVMHICVHKLRGTSKPRASRRRNRRGYCDPKTIRQAALRKREHSERTPGGGVELAANITLVRGWGARPETKVSKLHGSNYPRGGEAMEGTSGYAPRFSFRDEARRATLRRARLRSSMFDQLIPRRRATAPSFGPPFQTDTNISW